MEKAKVNSNELSRTLRKFNWRKLNTNESVLIIVIIIVGALITFLNRNFLSVFNLLNILDAVSIVGIASIGATFVLIGGELDLSVGSMLGLSAICASWAMQAGIPWPVAIIIGLGVGALGGLANGLVVTRFNISSFIVTLGMLSIARGIGLLITGGMPISTPSSISFIGQGRLGPLPINVLLLIILAVLFQFVLTMSVIGRRVQAVGDSRVASFLSGIPVARTKIFIFMLAGAMAAMAGIVRMSALSVAEANAGQGQELDIIAAVVIGGTSLSGGRGSVIGALLGACLLGIIRNAFVMLHLSPFFQTMSIGLVIVLAALLDQIRLRQRSR